MQESEIRFIFDKISALRVGVIGDFAVDFYYDLQKNTNEFSLETRQQVWWGSRPRTSLGAAGNVVQNLAALGVSELKAFGAIGQDMYGREMQHLMQSLGVDITGIRVQDESWETCTYTKPLHQEAELNRIDFGTHNTLSEESFAETLKTLRTQLPKLDVLIINQQFDSPLLTRERVEQLNALITIFPKVFVLADMRAFGKALRGATLKVNTEELARLLDAKGHAAWTSEQCAFYGKQLADIILGPVLITRGDQGIQYIEDGQVYQSAALPLTSELDTVGAGGTTVAAFAACMGAGVPIQEALSLANIAAAVTIQKLNQTGTASQEEIIAVANAHHPSFCTEPEA